MIFLSKENIGVIPKIYFLGLLLFNSAKTLSHQEIENRLNWIEVTQVAFSTQIMLDFNNPISFKKKLIKKDLCLKFSFPGMDISNFKNVSTENQLEKLRKLGLVTKTTLREKDNPIKKVIFSLNFAAINPHNNKKNKLLIKCSTIENPNRLIIDIFKEEKLNKLRKDDAVLLHAHNETIINESHQPTKKKNNTTLKINKRIIIDAGHGGSQPGTEHFGLQEKCIALDIAKQVQKKLNLSGFNAILTRNSDETLSLQERSEFASQLKADLFVSIHANAAPLGKSDENGIETFYLDSKYIFPQQQKNHFILMNLEQHHNYPKLVNEAHRKNINSSKKLAHLIQDSLIQTVKKKNYSINNRGIKKNGFRVLLRSQFPAALVEVGFLTNKKEATNLSQSSYRTILANGICEGIKNYLATNK